MIIADSGSTKTDWRIIRGSKVIKIETAGINPFYQDYNSIYSLISSEVIPLTDNHINNIFFYGAGCIKGKPTDKINNIFAKLFPGASVEVNSDLLGAARALCENKPGIACILGTGANSCIFNGKQIVYSIPSLGFMLGDEGSGALLGKKLIVHYLRGFLPGGLSDGLEKQFDCEKQEIMQKVYKEAFPNRYLAGFCKFISENQKYEYLQVLINEHFKEFFSKIICKYPDFQSNKVHIVGSIGFYFKTEIEKVSNNYEVELGNIIQSPVNKLVEYHKNKSTE